jgi:hypothetical protein
MIDTWKDEVSQLTLLSEESVLSSEYCSNPDPITERLAKHILVVAGRTTTKPLVNTLKQFSAGYTVTVARSMADVYRVLAMPGQQSQNCTDLILLSIKRERDWSYLALADIKHNDWYRKIPAVVLISGKADATVLMTCQELANACVPEPSSPAGYRSLVKSIVRFWFGVATVWHE